MTPLPQSSNVACARPTSSPERKTRASVSIGPSLGPSLISRVRVVIVCPVSVGACLISSKHEWNDWYAHADAALYQAKRLGGNRVQWQDAELTPA